MAHIDIDEHRWPIVIITFSGKEKKGDMLNFLEKLEAFRSREEDFCFVMDLREMGNLPLDARNLLINWLKQADLHQLTGTAMVVSSSLMRLYLSSIIWMAQSLSPKKSRFKHKTVFSLSEAYEWSRERLQKMRYG